MPECRVPAQSGGPRQRKKMRPSPFAQRVRYLEVSVQDGGVHVGEGVGDLQRDVQHLPQRHPAATRVGARHTTVQQLVQARVHQLQHQAGRGRAAAGKHTPCTSRTQVVKVEVGNVMSRRLTQAVQLQHSTGTCQGAQQEPNRREHHLREVGGEQLHNVGVRQFGQHLQLLGHGLEHIAGARGRRGAVAGAVHWRVAAADSGASQKLREPEA